MSIWQEIGSTVANEFSDLSAPTAATRAVVRLLLAAVLGGILGYDRQQRGKAAGLRTHMLVSLGAALFVMVPQQAGVSNSDLTRVLQGLVAGIGFLGAGTIIKGRGEEQIQGLTTAAGIWLTAAVGVAAGMGRDATAVLCTAMAFVILGFVPRLERHIENRGSQASGS